VVVHFGCRFSIQLLALACWITPRCFVRSVEDSSSDIPTFILTSTVSSNIAVSLVTERDTVYKMMKHLQHGAPGDNYATYMGGRPLNDKPEVRQGWKPSYQDDQVARQERMMRTMGRLVDGYISHLIIDHRGIPRCGRVDLILVRQSREFPDVRTFQLHFWESGLGSGYLGGRVVGAR
jgi:hypothetical protein